MAIHDQNESTAQALSFYDVTNDGITYVKPSLPAKSNVSVKTLGDSKKATVFQWSESPLKSGYDARQYDLRIKDASGKTVYKKLGLTTLTHEVILPAGTYSAYICAVNNKYYEYYTVGATVTFVVPEHTHTWNSGTITKTATCTATGVKTYTCSTCNATKTESIPINASNHVNTKNVAAVASTCTVKGYSAGVYCNDCKKYISGHAEQALAAHKTVTQNAKNATCTDPGYTGDEVCTVCKNTINKGAVIAKLNHTDPDANGNCTRCGTHLKDVAPADGGNSSSDSGQTSGGCPYCHGTHSGPFGWFIQIIHNILAIFKR